MPARRWLSLTHAGLGKLIPGGVGATSPINIWSQKAFSRHAMLHLYSAHRATLVHNRAGSSRSSSLAGTNECLDSNCRSCRRSGYRAFLVNALAPNGGELHAVRLFSDKAQWDSYHELLYGES